MEKKIRKLEKAGWVVRWEKMDHWDRAPFTYKNGIRVVLADIYSPQPGTWSIDMKSWSAAKVIENCTEQGISYEWCRKCQDFRRFYVDGNIPISDCSCY